MLARLPAILLLALTACASHEGQPAPTPTPTPTPTPEPRAEITVAIASVQLAQDCPDPASDTAAAPTGTAANQPANQEPYAPPPPASDAVPAAKRGSMQEPSAAAKRMAPGGTWTPPCVQSTMQLSFTNAGERPGKIEVKTIRLFDAETRRELSPIVGRKPSEWNEDGTYRPWNEQVAAKATAKAAYRVGEPDWGKVQGTLGDTVDLYARPFVLEVEVAVDGAVQTVRSPEFNREPIHMVVT